MSLRAKARAWVAVALVAVLALVPSPARADQIDSWWLPPTWAEVISGVVDVGINVLTGGQQAVTTGAAPFQVYEERPSIWRFGSSVYVPELVGLDSTGWPLIGWTFDECVAGAAAANCGGPPESTIQVILTRNGVNSTVNMDFANGVNSLHSYHERAGVSKIEFPGRGDMQTSQYGWIFYPSPDLAVTTTDLVCRPFGGGSDFVVSESSAPGAEVAPSPVCPAGSAPVRITVTNSVDGVLSDVSITAPDWYLADPSSVEYGFTVDGIICMVGRPDCDGLRVNPQLWDPATNACYARQRNLDKLQALNVSYPSAVPGPGDAWVKVPDEMCLDRPDSQLPISEPPETPDDPDLGVITRGIERLIEAVNAAGSAVRAAGAGAVKDAQAMREKVEAFRQDVKDKLDGLGGELGEKLDGLGDGVDGIGDQIGRAVTPDPGVMDGLGDRAAAALGDPFGDWTGALAAVPAAFNVPAGDCQGPAITIRGAGTHYPFQSCSGAGKDAAGFVQIAVGAGVVLAGLLGCVRILGSSIGLNLPTGGDSA